MKNIADLDLKGQRVLIRVDFNVPLKHGIVVDDYRIRASLPTINYCINKGAAVILMSHLGRPEGKIIAKMSLVQVVLILENILEKKVLFSDNCISDEALEISRKMKPGEIHLLENLRFHKGETENNQKFTWLISRHANIYINDAFGTAHREHASTVGIAKYITNIACGFLIEKEMEYLYNSLKKPLKPTVLILGGAKIYDKIALIDNMINKITTILIGGSMAFTFLKVQGKNTGKSFIDEECISIADKILRSAKKRKVNVILPTDVVSAVTMSKNASVRVSTLNDLHSDESGFDIGPETIANFEFILASAKTIIWNGPLGVCEIPLFTTGTKAIASAVRNRTEYGAISIIGGGDTASALKTTGINEGFSHISTGGGASLQLLSGRKLPAFEILNIYDQN